MFFRGRYLGLALLILVDVFVYALVLDQFMGLARGEASLGPSYATEATLMRLVPTVAIPGIAAIAGGLTFWLAGQKTYLSLLVAAFCMFLVDWIAIFASIPVA